MGAAFWRIWLAQSMPRANHHLVSPLNLMVAHKRARSYAYGRCHKLCRAVSHLICVQGTVFHVCSLIKHQ